MALVDLWTNYWWIILIIAGLLLLWIYSRLDSYTKLSIRKILSGKTLMIICFIGGWYLWNKYGGSGMVSNANRWVPVIFFAFMMGFYYLGKLRYETNQIVTPNFHGSFSKPPFKVNGFYIFLIDTFNAGGLSWDYADRLLILREETCELMPFGAVSIASPSFATEMDINPEVWEFITSNKFCKGAVKDVYYGWFDDIERVDWDFEKLKQLEEEKQDTKNLYNMLKQELKIENPRVLTLLFLYRNVCKALNKQNEWYNATIGNIEIGGEHRKRMKDLYAPTEKDETIKPKEEDY